MVDAFLSTGTNDIIIRIVQQNVAELTRIDTHVVPTV